MNPDVLSQAIVLWTGWHRSDWPAPDDDRLLEKYDSLEAAELALTIHELEDEFYLSDARDRFNSLAEMGNAAAAEFRAKHPELSDEAIEAFAWCYTHDYK